MESHCNREEADRTLPRALMHAFDDDEPLSAHEQYAWDADQRRRQTGVPSVSHEALLNDLGILRSRSPVVACRELVLSEYGGSPRGNALQRAGPAARAVLNQIC